ncbi:MAG: DUF389 domain-containing protein [Acidimicrobiales bacterium]|nr:DUF389 domain-containing protein [Acidimicrobiales bacterium]
MPAVADAQLARMREQFFDGPDRGRKLSRFWVLLALSAVIASAGVAADSTATVIGAMIVAPLMTPIIGIVLAIVVADRANLARSVVLVVGGAALVIVLGWMFGKMAPVDVVAVTSSQVSSRVSPRLVDLIAALATGAVGAFALVRDDVSDTLPGVAIAISLVPPLAVVGLTLEGGAPSQSLGALLLFLTNVAAILLSGVVVMALYRVPRAASRSQILKPVSRRRAVLVVVVMVVAVSVPLAATSVRVASDTVRRGEVANVARDWAGPAGWRIATVDSTEGAMVVRARGPLPSPDPDALRTALDDAGLADVSVRLELVPEEQVELPAPSRGGSP